MHRLPGALDHQRIERALLGEGQSPKGRGQGEGHQEILARHQLLELALEPLLALVVLTVRAAAMPARMWHQALMVAVGASGQHRRTCRGAAIGHRRQCLAMRWQERVLILRQELGLEELDDGREQDHSAFPQSMEKPFISALMTCLALLCVVDVRWV